MKYLVTSALPYINGIKHLGNLIGSMLPADVYARFLRQQGEEVLYICGTDEHGTPAELAAKENNQEIASYCSHMYEVQKDIYERFGIKFDYFGRSSSPANHELTKEIFLDLDKNGYISTKEIKQFYSHHDQRFLPDRYVTGTCPYCNFDKAKGDQCDGCGKLLEPLELKNPKSVISGSSDLEVRTSKHLFLQLDKLSEKIEKWVASRNGWPEVVKGIAKKWLKEGLQERCITRDLEWGIKVPKEGFEDKVFYVWFDAPNGYISITKDFTENWQKWWLPENEKEVQYVQFMAKDNVPFHSIFWPAMLMASDKNWKQVDIIKGFHWLTYEGGKFSTSMKRGVFTDTALELFPADFWRYYLMANIPETSDADFNFHHFASTVNKDLADVLGNFINRSMSLVNKYYQGLVPISINSSNLDQELFSKIQLLVEKLSEGLKNLKFRQAMQDLRELWCLGNEYITVAAPWELNKTDEEKCKIVLAHTLWLIRLYAIISSSIIPYSAKAIFEMLCLKENLENKSFKDALDYSALKEGHKIGQAIRLFNKIETEDVESLVIKYSGNA